MGVVFLRNGGLSRSKTQPDEGGLVRCAPFASLFRMSWPAGSRANSAEDSGDSGAYACWHGLRVAGSRT